jgi:hypothetical protein
VVGMRKGFGGIVAVGTFKKTMDRIRENGAVNEKRDSLAGGIGGGEITVAMALETLSRDNTRQEKKQRQKQIILPAGILGYLLID